MPKYSGKHGGRMRKACLMSGNSQIFRNLREMKKHKRRIAKRWGISRKEVNYVLKCYDEFIRGL